jgi:amino acid adenylation domain-containing protein
VTTKKQETHNPFKNGKILLAVSTTESQSEIWSTTKINIEASKAYVESLKLELTGELDTALLQKAYDLVLSRHDSLHGTFSKNGKYFLVKEAYSQAFISHDFSANTDEKLNQFLNEETKIDFDLVEGPLTRASLIKINEVKHVFVFSAHHIICDGWSIAIVLKELSQIYNALISGVDHNLEWPVQFYEYATRIKNEPSSHKKYWIDKFKNNNPHMEIPLSFDRPKSRTYESERLDVNIEADLVKQLKKIGARNGCSFYTTLMAGFSIFLSKLAKSNDVVFGISAAAQSTAGQDDLVGHLVSLLPMSEKVNGSDSIKQVLRQIKSSMMDAFENQSYTFGSLLKDISIERDPSRIPLVNVIFNVDQQYPGQSMEFRSLDAHYTTVPRHYENFELFFNMVTCGDDLYVECQYNSNLFEKNLILSWINSYIEILTLVTVNIDLSVDSILLNQNCFTGLIDFKKQLDESVKKKEINELNLDINLKETITSIWETALGFDEIPSDISFFAIGGHSIMGLDIIAQIELQLDKSISLKDLFENPSINELSLFLTESKNLDKVYDVDVKNSIPAVSHPVTVKQMGVLYLEQLNEATTMHNLPSAFHINQKLNLDIFSESINIIVKNHPCLRSYFLNENNNFNQHVIDESEIDFKYSFEDICEEKLQERLQSLTTSVFDLEKGPLFKINIFKLKEDHFVIFFMVHHIIWDGWCFDIFFDELDSIYSSLLKNNQPIINSENLSFSEYANWHKEFLASEKAKKEIDFWINKLSLPLPVLEFPIDKIRPVEISHIGKSIDFSLNKEQTLKLKRIAKSENVSFFNILLASFKLVLAKFSAEEEIIMGTPVRSRPTAKLNSTIGYFVNIVAIRSLIDKEIPYKELIKNITYNTNEAISNDNVPFEIISNVLKIERDTSRTPVFQTFFSFQDISNRPNEFNGEKKRRVILDKASAHTDIDLSVRAASELTEFLIEYRVDLFEEQTMIRLKESLVHVLNNIESFLDKKVKDISIIPDNQMNTLLVDWNDTKVENDDRPFFKIFEESVLKYPDNLAVEDDKVKLTYKQLDLEANCWANKLISMGVKPGDNVGISTDRNAHMIVGLLAILKTGAGYIPLEPSFPQDRLDYMIESSGLSSMLVQDHLAGRFSSDLKKLSIDDLKNSKDLDPSVIDVQVSLEDTCYIIYTSGSTGLPKGVELLHGSVTNFLQSVSKVPGMNEGDSMLAVTTLSFDIAVLELYLPLLVGASVFVASKEQTIDGDELKSIINKNKINTMQATPSTWRLLLASDWSGDLNFKVLCGGEPFPKDLAQKLCPIAKEVWNMYGPTETTVWSTCHKVNLSDLKMYIGKPIDNTGIFILDDDLRPVPIGATGEMYISGDGLANGYKGRDDLTDAVFIKNPNLNNLSIYNTGDLARYHYDGKLECLGRNDGQVKVRGYRIELGEIESVISKFKDVIEAVVVTREDIPGDIRIVAYLRISNTKLDQIGIRTFISNSLPTYMMPSHFVILETFPKTLNEKIDKKKLKSKDHRPGSISITNKKEVLTKSISNEPNQTEIIIDNHIDVILPEKIANFDLKTELRSIWKDVLCVDFIDDDVDLYSLGGHSISMLSIISKIKFDLNLTIKLKDFLENNSILKMHDFLSIAVKDKPIKKNLLNKKYIDIPANENQNKIFYYSQYYGNSSLYNLPTAMKCSGLISKDVLTKSFLLFIERHQMLRTNFFEKDDQLFQSVREMDKVSFEIEEVNIPENRIIKEVDKLKNKVYNFESDLLFDIKLFQVENDKSVLFFMPHHIIWDGQSFDIYIKELNLIYNSLILNKEPVLSNIEMNFADYTLDQQSFLSSDSAEEEIRYWKSTFYKIPKPIDFPHANVRPETMTNIGKRLDFTLDNNLSEKLIALASYNNISVFGLLFGAYNLFLSKFLDRQDIVVGIPVSGRTDHRLNNTIGYFVNSLPIYSIINKDITQILNIKNTFNNFIEGFENQRIPFDLIVKNLELSRDTSRTPVYQTFFTFREKAGEVYEFGNKEISYYKIDRASTHTDLDITILSNPKGLKGYFDYRVDLFDSSNMNEFCSSWIVFLSDLVKNSEGDITKVEKACESKSFEERVIDIWSNLLGFSELDSSSDFFKLGGHSILALKMFSKIEKEFNYKISFKQFFSDPTIFNVCKTLEQNDIQASDFKLNAADSNQKTENLIEFTDFAGFNQKSMHFSEMLSPESTANNLPIALSVIGDIDYDVFQNTINILIDRHESLRTSFTMDKETLSYTVFPKGKVKYKPEFETLDESSIIDTIKENSSYQFDLSHAPLFKSNLFKVSENHFVIFFMFHHIIWDGSSFDLFKNEFSEIYTSLENNKLPQLNSINSNLSDFIKSENHFLSTPQRNKSEKFWKEHLKSPLPVLELPTDKVRPKQMEFSGSLAQFKIHKELKLKLEHYAIENGVTFYNLFLTVFKVCLSSFSNNNDIIVGTPVNGRPSSDYDYTTGYFVNTIPIRSSINLKKNFKFNLMNVRNSLYDCLEHQSLPFENIYRSLDINRDISRTPIFQTLFSYIDHTSTNKSFMGRNSKSILINRNATHTDLDLWINNYDDIIHGDIQFYNKVYSKEMIQHLIEFFISTLKTIVEKEPKNLLDLMPPNHKKTLQKWSTNPLEIENTPIIRLIERQFYMHPHLKCFVAADCEMTYEELDKESNRWANGLVERGVRPGDLVGLLTERNSSMIIGLIAILKSGAGYVPLEPSLPKDRLDFILKESKIKTILAEDHLVKRYNFDQSTVKTSNLLKIENTRNPFVLSSLEDTMYIIFTSGSTGAPKGVDVTNRSVTNLIQSISKAPGVNINSKFLAVTTLSFDVSVCDIFLPLLNGSSIILATKEQVMDGNELNKLITKHDVNTMQGTPSSFRLLLESGFKGRENFKVLCAGEAFPKDLANRLLPICSEVWNLYGPTEATVYTTLHQINKTDKRIFIGRPIHNTEVFILDDNLMQVPIGAAGVLYIAGNCLAKGYKNRDDLTTQSFIVNKNLNNKLMYNSGDNARFSSCGNIEYLGRSDGQVKIRGYRIELGEIESLLAKNESVLESIVIVQGGNSENARITAFVKSKTKFNSRELRKYLKEKLPAYMIPSNFVEVQDFEKTLSGKIDKKKLPKVSENISSKVINTEISNDYEKDLLEIWKELLKTDDILIDDSFFDIGGHSLLAVVLFNRIEKRYKVNILLASLFLYPTIKELAILIQSELGEVTTTISKKNNIIVDNLNSPIFQSLVPIRTSGENTPIFMFHSVGGNVLNYARLAAGIDSSYPIFGFQSRGVDGISQIDNSIEKMAESYIVEMKLVSPNGPYILCGGSMGGSIALEVAIQLERSGDKVSKLIMFDTFGPNINIKKLKNEGNNRFKNLKISFHYRSLTLLNKTRTFLFKCFGIPIPHSIRYFNIEMNNYKAIWSYKPVSYNGDLLLFRVPIDSSGWYSDPVMGWKDTIKGKIRTVELDGDHNTFTDNNKLVTLLNEELLL